MQNRQIITKEQAGGMDPQILQQHFICNDLFAGNQLHLEYTGYDDLIIGGVKPLDDLLLLANHSLDSSAFFLENRELGIVNIGGEGLVSADGVIYEMAYLSCTYLGKGTTDVSFSSVDPGNPAMFYLVATACSQVFANKQIAPDDLMPAGQMLSPGNYKYIHQTGIESCTLLLGIAIVNSGVINDNDLVNEHRDCTKAYLYFGIPAGSRLLHHFGETAGTIAFPVKNLDAVVAPGWHTATFCQPGNYTCICAIVARNQEVVNG